MRGWSFLVSFRFLFCLLCIGSIVAIAAPVFAATYFVSPSGSDTSDGTTLVTAFRTPRRAVAAIKAGDTVIVKAGTYPGFQIGHSDLGGNYEKAGTLTNPIVFRGEPGALIEGPNSVSDDAIWIYNSSWIVIDGFEVSKGLRNGIRVGGSNNITIKNNKVHHSEKANILVGTSDDITISQNETYASTMEHGVYASSDSDRLTIIKNRIHDNPGNGIQFNAGPEGDQIMSDSVIRANLIYENGDCPAVRLTGMRCGGAAIHLGGANYTLVENNVLVFNHASGIKCTHLSGASSSTDNIISNNTVIMASDGAAPLEIVNESHNNTAYNNILFPGQDSKGSINMSSEITGLLSDYNVVVNRFNARSEDPTPSLLPLSIWAATTGQDAHSLVSTPSREFVDSLKDFHLKAGAYALDHALVTASASDDVEERSRPRGTSFDIGAYEGTESGVFLPTATATPTRTPTPQGPTATPTSTSTPVATPTTTSTPGITPTATPTTTPTRTPTLSPTQSPKPKTTWELQVNPQIMKSFRVASGSLTRSADGSTEAMQGQIKSSSKLLRVPRAINIKDGAVRARFKVRTGKILTAKRVKISVLGVGREQIITTVLLKP